MAILNRYFDITREYPIYRLLAYKDFLINHISQLSGMILDDPPVVQMPSMALVGTMVGCFNTQSASDPYALYHFFSAPP